MFRVAIPHSRNGTLQKLATLNSFRRLPIRFVSSATSARQLAPQSTKLLLANTRNTALAWKQPSSIVLFSTSPKHAITAEGRDKGLEKQLQSEKLERNPDGVTSTSSIRAIVEESQAPPPGKEVKIKAGLSGDFHMIKETFALQEVPREATFLGLSGLIPYVTTSATTLFLAYDVKHIHSHGVGYIFSEQQATTMLSYLEPLQIGYGAVILSFLGAIHWGLEFAKFGGSSPYTRYGLGVMATIIAWPTVFMPYDYALLAQFGGFVAMYFADARITSRGWAPRWYTTYRFILTFVVGASIVMSLVGRGQIGDALTLVSSPVERASGLKSSQRIGLEKETGGEAYQQKLVEEEQAIKENKKLKEEKGKKEQEEEEAKKKQEEAKTKKDNTGGEKDAAKDKGAAPKDKPKKDESKDAKKTKAAPKPDQPDEHSDEEGTEDDNAKDATKSKADESKDAKSEEKKDDKKDDTKDGEKEDKKDEKTDEKKKDKK